MGGGAVVVVVVVVVVVDDDELDDVCPVPAHGSATASTSARSARAAVWNSPGTLLVLPETLTEASRPSLMRSPGACGSPQYPPPWPVDGTLQPAVRWASPPGTS